MGRRNSNTEADAGSRPAVGIVATLRDYSTVAPALTSSARVILLDERSAIAAVRERAIDLLIVVPRLDWWAERPATALLEGEAARAHVGVLAAVPRGDAVALALAFDSGVADCLAYPFDLDELAVRARALLRRKKAADQLRTSADEARRLALTDPVTGLWNRHYLDTDLATKVAAAHSAARSLSLLMIDIDRFKPINDRYGHAVGDAVLRSIAARMSAGIRGGDTLARFGGDELALIMPDTGLDMATGVAERLRTVVATPIPEVPCGVTISVGVAELGFDEPAESLLGRADKALYAAKVEGRNRVAAA